MIIDWASFSLGVFAGFILGAVSIWFFNRGTARSEDLLAWAIAGTWLIWNVSVGLGIVTISPPTMYDVVSGGAVGFILGEKFFTSIGSIFRK